MTARYSFGGDEHLFIEIAEEMSLDAFFEALAICDGVRGRHIDGVTEICPANASLQIRFDPDRIPPDRLLAEVKEVEARVSGATGLLQTRIIEMPVYYNDPWTHETLMRFRERHQDPSSTDLEYAARVNGYREVSEIVAAHSGSPWLVSMVGFVAGCPFLFQMVERERQLEVPKYLRPRTDTPRLTVGHGGCFTAIYPVRGAGGYQMLGITPMPIYDPTQQTGYLRDFMILFKPGDIVKFRPVERKEYDLLVEQIDRGTFRLKEREIAFSLADYHASPAAYGRKLMEVLNGD